MPLLSNNNPLRFYLHFLPYTISLFQSHHLFLFLLLLPGRCLAFSRFNFDDRSIVRGFNACDMRRPFHFPFFAQDPEEYIESGRAIPYVVHGVDNDDGSFDVTLESHPPFMYKGVLLQAMDERHVRVGEFTAAPDDYLQMINCGFYGGAVAHVDATPKRKLTVKWEPKGFRGNVTFSATFVRSYSEFWSNINAVHTIH